MKKRILGTLAILSTALLAGCSWINANYIPSTGVLKQRVAKDKILVFYDKKDVPFQYKEIGRVFLQNFNYCAYRDPGGQVNKIIEQAAEYGADAVIVINESRRESSFMVNSDGSAGGHAGDVFQYFGIAIVKE